MPNINITVAEKIATNTTPGVVIVCGNSDYTVAFDFDEEWAAETERVARFLYYKDGLSRFQDVAFTGNTAAVPVLSGVDYVLVGVYAGSLHTTTPAKVLCDRSILCGNPLEDLSPAAVKNLQKQIDDLAKSGGGGMGGADWNAAEGEPGHVLNRTHWVEYGGIVEIPVSGQWEDESGGEGTAFTFYFTAPIGLEIGKTYTVNWNGTDYEVVGQDAMAVSGEMPGVFLGNHDGDDTGVPFIIAELPADIAAGMGGIYGMAMGVDKAQATLAVYAVSETVHKLSPKFLPDGVGIEVYDVPFELTMTGDSFTASTEKSFDEIFIKANTPGMIVRAIVNSGGNRKILQLSGCREDCIEFQTADYFTSPMVAVKLDVFATGEVNFEQKTLT